MDDTVAMFIVIIVGMALAAALIAIWIKYHANRPPLAGIEAGPQIEALRAENEQLNERLAVLERIATDPSERTARAIEELR